MSIVKLVMWKSPADPRLAEVNARLQKYVMVGTLVVAEPLMSLDEFPQGAVVETTRAAELEEWLRSVTPRASRQPGRNADCILMEMNYQ